MGLTAESFQGVHWGLESVGRRISKLIVIHLKLLRIGILHAVDISAKLDPLFIEILNLLQRLLVRSLVLVDVESCLTEFREKFKFWIILRFFSTFRYLRVKRYTSLIYGSQIIFGSYPKRFGLPFVFLDDVSIVYKGPLRAIWGQLSSGTLDKQTVLLASLLPKRVLTPSLMILRRDIGGFFGKHSTSDSVGRGTHRTNLP